MNRRGFLASLFAIPAAAIAMPAPKKVIMSTDYGKMDNAELPAPFQILNPAELRRAGLTPVTTPYFFEDKVAYCVKTWRLSTYCDGYPDIKAIVGAKRKVIHEIKRLQLTHIYCVEFTPYPLMMPDWQRRYNAYVRGCRLKPWDFSQPSPSFGLDSYDSRTA